MPARSDEESSAMRHMRPDLGAQDLELPYVPEDLVPEVC
jgi:hypothetical protein